MFPSILKPPAQHQGFVRNAVIQFSASLPRTVVCWSGVCNNSSDGVSSTHIISYHITFYSFKYRAPVPESSNSRTNVKVDTLGRQPENKSILCIQRPSSAANWREIKCCSATRVSRFSFSIYWSRLGDFQQCESRDRILTFLVRNKVALGDLSGSLRPDKHRDCALATVGNCCKCCKCCKCPLLLPSSPLFTCGVWGMLVSPWMFSAVFTGTWAL